MKKLLLVVILAVSISSVSAQTGNNKIGIAFDLGIPTGEDSEDVQVGIGGQLRGLLGVGTAGQISLTTGYMRFGFKDMPSGMDASISIIPILLGYRHNFSGFYLEPQAGYGIYGAKAEYLGVEEDESEGAFTWAIGAGYALASGLDLGVRYQSGQKDGNSGAKIVGIHLGWNFSLGSGATMKK